MYYHNNDQQNYVDKKIVITIGYFHVKTYFDLFNFFQGTSLSFFNVWANDVGEETIFLRSSIDTKSSRPLDEERELANDGSLPSLSSSFSE